MSGNLFHMPEDSEKADSAILLDLGGGEYQSESFCLFNNNFIDTASIVIDIPGVLLRYLIISFIQPWRDLT